MSSILEQARNRKPVISKQDQLSIQHSIYTAMDNMDNAIDQVELAIYHLEYINGLAEKHRINKFLTPKKLQRYIHVNKEFKADLLASIPVDRRHLLLDSTTEERRASLNNINMMLNSLGDVKDIEAIEDTIADVFRKAKEQQEGK